MLNNPLKYVDPTGNRVRFSSGGSSIYTDEWEATDPMEMMFIEELLIAAGQDAVNEMADIALGWYELEESASGVVDYLEQAEEVYTIMYFDVEKGGSYDSDTRTIKVDINNRGNSNLTTVTLAHESVHAIAGKGSSSSIFEEVTAYQFEYFVADSRGIGITHPNFDLSKALNTSLYPPLYNYDDLSQVRRDWGQDYQDYSLTPKSRMSIIDLLYRVIFPYLK